MLKIKHILLLIVLGVILTFVGMKIYDMYKENELYKRQLLQMEASISQFDTMYYAERISSLKKSNKELYDSLKMYKDQIDLVTQFKYEKEYNLDTVHTKKEKDIQKESKDTVEKVYEYTNKDNDSITYKLKIGSYTEPNWYKLDVKVSNQFTIVNKQLWDGENQLTIDTKYDGTISNVTVLKNNTKTFWDNFSVGPTVAAGYDFINNKPAIVVGVGVTWKINFNKK